jgi:tetratricopeptide (TPR) repeat protein
VQLDGSVSTPRLALAETLIRLGRADEAEDHLQFALRTDRENPRALFGMGCVANDRGDLPASRDYLQHSARLAPNFKSAHTLLAEVYRRLGDQEQANRERALAASLSPKMHWPDPYSTLIGPPLRGQKEVIDRANALLKENRAQESLQLLKEMPPGSDQWYRKHLQFGRAYEKLGDYDAAEKAFREALRLKPGSLEVLAGLGITLQRQGNFSAAAEQFRKALEIKPDAANLYFRLGRCLDRLDDRAGAIEAMQNSVRYKPDAPIAYRELAKLLKLEGRTSEARAALEHALELEPNDASSAALLDRLNDEPPDNTEIPTVE